MEKFISNEEWLGITKQRFPSVSKEFIIATFQFFCALEKVGREQSNQQSITASVKRKGKGRR